jgi:hypothetical protein
MDYKERIETGPNKLTPEEYEEVRSYLKEIALIIAFPIPRMTWERFFDLVKREVGSMLPDAPETEEEKEES